MNTVVTPQQLHLNVSIRQDATFDNFFVPAGSKNAEVLTTIKTQLNADEGSFLYLWGASGCGLTHLLQAACHWMTAHSRTSVYLPLRDVAGYAPQALLEGLESQSLICVDHLDAITGNSAWEESLFDLYNRVREQHGHLMVAATAGPHELPLDLADLRSRLSAGYSYLVESLSDNEKPVALRRNAHARGLEMSEEVAQFILNRAPRDMNDLFAILEQLDEVSLRTQRKLTIPFVKQVLGL